MNKERLEGIKRQFNIIKSNLIRLDRNTNATDDYEWLIKQAELADYYRHQSKRKTQALEKIVDLLTEDYFENWEQALEIAHKYKRNSVRLDNLGSDLRIREMEEEE